MIHQPETGRGIGQGMVKTKNKMSVIIDKIKARADRLGAVRKEMDAIKLSMQETLDKLQIEKDDLQAELIAAFNKHEITSIKSNDGHTYAKATRKGVEIVSEPFALKWATDNHCVSVNKILCAQKFKDMDEMPAGFEKKTIEYISVRSPKVDKTESESKS